MVVVARGQVNPFAAARLTTTSKIKIRNSSAANHLHVVNSSGAQCSVSPVQLRPVE